MPRRAVISMLLMRKLKHDLKDCQFTAEDTARYQLSCKNLPLFQPSDQVTGFIFLTNSIYYSLSIFLTYSLPDIFTYNNREREEVDMLTSIRIQVSVISLV